ncbi:solute carrier family 22 member 6 [Polypterus senegalus]
MGFADILEEVGSRGPFQILHVTLLTIPMLMLASHNLLQNFVAAVPQHHCLLPPNLTDTKLPADLLLRVSVPIDSKGKPERCIRFAEPQWHVLNQNWTAKNLTAYENSEFTFLLLNQTENNILNVELQRCDHGWQYQQTDMTSTIISEWDLVCDLRSLKQMSQTIYMAGVLVGSLIFGSLSDRLGRRFLLLWAHLQMAVAGTCVAFSPSFAVFCFFRFLTGMALSGIILNSLSLIVEWVSMRVRTIVGTGTGYGYTLGQLILAGLAYFIRDWRWLTLAVSLPFYVFFFYTWWFPESARWLVLNHKADLAVTQLKKVARLNGKTEACKKINTEKLKSAMHSEMTNLKGSYTALDLVRTAVMRRITICLVFVWFSTSFSYYGLSMDLQKFGVSIYLIQLIFGAVDIPAKLISTVTMSYIGRRVTQSASLVLAGVTIVINIFIPQDLQNVRTSLAVLGKGCLASSFSCCYLYSGELYPTVVRQSGMGIVSMMARLGAMTAPLVLLLGDYIPVLPMVIYGGSPIISGIIAIFLPETLNIPLPDTIEEVEMRAKPESSKAETNIKEAIILQEITPLGQKPLPGLHITNEQ